MGAGVAQNTPRGRLDVAKKRSRRSLWLFLGGFLLVVGGYWYFSDDSDPGTGQGGPTYSPVYWSTPKEAVIAVYQFTAHGDAGKACALFSPEGRDAFARNSGGGDCQQAVQRLNGRVTNRSSYANPGFPEGAVTVRGDRAEVRSCQMTVDGGQRLGAFVLSRLPNGTWAISGHEAEPADCRTG
ncbi:hypothetical protein LX15_004076 [Streptoalloteichus tenebrarius]|uniref:Nuclear transport factor 2 family protein n=1 Tax=Streptoalloteichus tenebrarius (strain ATCC 17920 / DSM 40477 / JCM 4838 / CBS 697.72 / NBRC 16177 / NCIMB 11028 / NRRL B-12390 / A12253. 1 / ISP 5477) TaxID=1933 RepID=A0ABT1HXV1_STRSD|nr:hypothetical protein [Streptoalloteichus tenebrarius]MCP2260362.1 hypothetical protein [Streptoalloteichus tenebrarius]